MEVKPSVASWDIVDWETFTHLGSAQAAYSFEAKIALFETWIRGLVFFPELSFEWVKIPELQLAGMTDRGVVPMGYMLAVAFDAVSGQQTNAAASSNPALSHIITGSNTLLTMFEVGDFTDTVTALKYNSVSGTIADKVQYPSDRYIYSAVLVAPTTGTNNITSTGNTFGGKAGVSYTGCAQTGQPDSHNGQYVSSASTNAVMTTTVVATGCWLVGYSYGGGVSGAGSGTTNRGTSTGSGIQPCDSNGTVSTGSQSLTQTQGNSAYVALALSIKPPVAGPTNLKSYNTNLKANIKSICTNLIANVKSLDTNT